MISAVLDTNVIVSAQLKADGMPAQISSLAMSRRFRCFVSEALLEEYEGVLLRPRFGFEAEEIDDFLQIFRGSAVLVSPRKRIAAALDATANLVLECALEARADYVVTGNIRHFPSRFQDIRIVTPRQFMTALRSEL